MPNVLSRPSTCWGVIVVDKNGFGNLELVYHPRLNDGEAIMNRLAKLWRQKAPESPFWMWLYCHRIRLALVPISDVAMIGPQTEHRNFRRVFVSSMEQDEQWTAYYNYPAALRFYTNLIADHPELQLPEPWRCGISLIDETKKVLVMQAVHDPEAAATRLLLCLAIFLVAAIVAGAVTHSPAIFSAIAGPSFALVTGVAGLLRHFMGL